MEKRDWKKIVNESEGQMYFVPEKFMEKVKEYSEKRKVFNDQLEAAAKNEIELGVLMNEIIFGIRKHLESAGQKIWQKDVNFNATALQDGEFIVNISDQK